MGFIGYSSRITEGELPPTVVARCYTAVGTFTSNLADCETDTVHGTGVAETIADIAPGAELYIANPSSAGDLQASAAWMVAQGVDVVNMSLSWTWDGPGDGTSPFSASPLNTVSSTVAGGVVWLNSAGNSAPSNWYGGYSDSDVDQWLEFSSGDETNAVFLQAGENFISQMRWNDDWGNAAIDLDLYLYDESATEVASSKDEQSGGAGQYPGEGQLATSTDPGTGDTHTATIDWGDGSPLEAGIVDQGAGTVSGSHAYADDGTYTVTVTVTDDDGGSGSNNITSTVNNLPPLVDAGQDRQVRAGVAFEVVAAFTDAGSEDSHTATIDWGDGSSLETALLGQATGTVSSFHTYSELGTFAVSVVVTDDDGAAGSDTLSVVAIPGVTELGLVALGGLLSLLMVSRMRRRGPTALANGLVPSGPRRWVP